MKEKTRFMGIVPDYWQPYLYLGYTITPYLQIYDNVDETQKYLKKIMTHSTAIIINI
jgi:hypothetical protein